MVLLNYLTNMQRLWPEYYRRFKGLKFNLKSYSHRLFTKNNSVRDNTEVQTKRDQSKVPTSSLHHMKVFVLKAQGSLCPAVSVTSRQHCAKFYLEWGTQIVPSLTGRMCLLWGYVTQQQMVASTTNWFANDFHRSLVTTFCILNCSVCYPMLHNEKQQVSLCGLNPRSKTKYHYLSLRLCGLAPGFHDKGIVDSDAANYVAFLLVKKKKHYLELPALLCTIIIMHPPKTNTSITPFNVRLAIGDPAVSILYAQIWRASFLHLPASSSSRDYELVAHFTSIWLTIKH